MDDKKKKQQNKDEDSVKQNENKEVKKDEVVLLKEKIEELENQVKRTLADYRNLENRASQERGEWILKANKQLLLNFLPVLDTLMLASIHSKDQNLEIATKQFLDTLKNEGVVRIETSNKDFDPNLMEGIATVEVDPSAGSGQEGKVIEELRTGYMLYDKVLRPAQVSVGKTIEDSK